MAIHHDELINHAKHTIYLFDQGMTESERARGVGDAAYQTAGSGTSQVRGRPYRLVHVARHRLPVAVE